MQSLYQQRTQHEPPDNNYRESLLQALQDPTKAAAYLTPLWKRAMLRHSFGQTWSTVPHRIPSSFRKI